MKILKIEPSAIEDMIDVHIEGYDHATPVFPRDITAEELKTQLVEWKINQDAVDIENANRVPTQVVEVDSKLKALEGKEI